MQVKDVMRELPAESQKTGQFGPSTVSHEERVRADIEWRCGAEFAPPKPNGAHVFEALVQQVHHETKHARQFAVANFILEIGNSELPKVCHLSISILPPTRRSSAG